MRFIGAILGCVLGGLSLNAQTEPVDKNRSGPFIGGDLHLMRGSTTDGNSGFGYAGSLDLGYVIKRDTWNRLELGIELGTAKLDLGDMGGVENVSLDTSVLAMVKGGFGYSLGDNAFGIWRLGVGLGETKLRHAENSFKGDAFIVRLGWDAVIPAGDSMSFVAGIYAQMTDSRFDSDAADDLELNVIAVHGGVRLGN